jgi:2-methylcitrate dehydratase PrpD
MMAEGKSGIMAGIGGNYGAAVAAAKILGLPPEKIIDALGIAEAHRPYPTPAAIWRDKDISLRKEFMKHTPMTKENCGWAALTGVTAALLAQAGFSAGRTIFDLPMYNRESLGTLGHEWEILDIYFKPYSTCRACHASIDGVLELIKERNLGPNDISKITIGLSSLRAEMANYRPSTRWEAQYSIPFVIGAAVAEGEVGPKQIADERLNNEAILIQADKVALVASPEVDALSPGIDASTVEIETKNGSKFKTFRRYPRGEPQNPLTEQDLSKKFTTLVAGALPVETIQELNKCLTRLEDLHTINHLLEKIAHCV